jgi:geranylgeranyl pyrophosphate synthase
MIHCYSLIHDDLPAMDDDDFRRGKPTCHKVFGEATAILAGDALLNLAYEVMISECVRRGPSALFTAQYIAEAAGCRGMIGGQMNMNQGAFSITDALNVFAFRPDLIIMDGRRSFISGGPSHGEQVKPGLILVSGDPVACDVTGIKILQEYYPNMAQNKITTYAWFQKQILQAVKIGIGFAKKDEDIKLILG